MAQQIEQTGKLWKGMQAFGALLCCVGVTACVVTEGKGPEAILAPWGLGLASFTLGRLGAWWNHG